MEKVRGKLRGVYVGTRRGQAKTEAGEAELVAGHGLRGDSHAGLDPDRQVSLFATEVLDGLRAEGFPVMPESLSANLLTELIGLDSLKPGSRLRIGETTIEIVEPRKPCRSITRVDKRLPKLLYGRCGQLGRIVEGGTVRPGDEIEVLIDQPALF